MINEAVTGLACIPSNYSRILARELGLQVRELPRLLLMTQLSVAAFKNEDTLLTAQQQLQILHNSLSLTDDPEIGFRFGKRLTPATHGALGALLNSSTNLLVGLQALAVFLPTRISFLRLALIQTKQRVTLKVHHEGNLYPDIQHMVSEAIALVFCECAEFINGQSVDEATISFPYAAPSNPALYEKNLPCAFTFNADVLTIELPLKSCLIQNASANKESFALAFAQCEKIRASLSTNKNTTTHQLQQLLLNHALGRLTEDEAAAMLFISKRTLARRLQVEGTSFRQVHDTILSQHASIYLRQSELSNDAIAALLNFHDSSNFRRAFKRWFNLTPSAYRALYAAQASPNQSLAAR